MSVGLHPRITGNPARADALARFIEYAQSLGDVWFARRSDIARTFVEQQPAQTVAGDELSSEPASGDELVSLVTCDLAGLVRGRSVPARRPRPAARDRRGLGSREPVDLGVRRLSPSRTRGGRPATCGCCPTRRPASASTAGPASPRCTSCCATSPRSTAATGTPAAARSCAARSSACSGTRASASRASFEHELVLESPRPAAARLLARGPAHGRAVRLAGDGRPARGRRRARDVPAGVRRRQFEIPSRRPWASRPPIAASC